MEPAVWAALGGALLVFLLPLGYMKHVSNGLARGRESRLVVAGGWPVMRVAMAATKLWMRLIPGAFRLAMDGEAMRRGKMQRPRHRSTSAVSDPPPPAPPTPCSRWPWPGLTAV